MSQALPALGLLRQPACLKNFKRARFADLLASVPPFDVSATIFHILLLPFVARGVICAVDKIPRHRHYPIRCRQSQIACVGLQARFLYSAWGLEERGASGLFRSLLKSPKGLNLANPIDIPHSISRQATRLFLSWEKRR